MIPQSGYLRQKLIKDGLDKFQHLGKPTAYKNQKGKYNQRFKRNLDIMGFNGIDRVGNFIIQATLRRIGYSYCTFLSGFLNSAFIVFGAIICLYSKSA